MADFEIKDGVAIIPEGTTVIEHLYYGHDRITSVAIPKSVTYISSGAFKDCSSLTNIVIPEGVIEIGSEAFWGCTSLKSIVIPESVKEIGDFAFHGCTSLTDVIFPKKTVLIRKGTFEGCTSLESFVIPENVRVIDPYVFHGCTNLKNIVIPKNVTKIGFHAFYDCPNLESIVVDADNKVYDSREGCNAIIETESNVLLTGGKATVIPESVAKVDFYAFSGFEFKVGDYSFEIISQEEKTCRAIGYHGKSNSFEAEIVCEIPETVTYEGDVYTVVEIGALKELYSFYGGKIKIPKTIISIGDRSFKGCNFSSITLPKGLRHIGDYAFENMDNLKSIKIPAGVETIGKKPFGVYGGMKFKITNCSPHFEWDGYGLYSIKENRLVSLIISNADPDYVVKPGTEIIGVGATISYYNRKGTRRHGRVILPEGLKVIENGALNKVDIDELPQSIEVIGQNALEMSCETLPPNLKSLAPHSGIYDVKESLSPYIIVEDGAIYESDKKKLLSFYNRDAVEYNIDAACEEICEQAFEYNRNLETIKLGENISKIGECAFLDCSNLKAIKVPANKVDYYKELLQSHTYRPGNIPELVVGI